jgi:hypothetical protein
VYCKILVRLQRRVSVVCAPLRQDVPLPSHPSPPCAAQCPVSSAPASCPHSAFDISHSLSSALSGVFSGVSRPLLRVPFGPAAQSPRGWC